MRQGKMTINIENEYSGSSAFIPQDDYEKIAREVILQALEEEGCPYECEIGLTLVNDDSIREINKEYRNIDRSTDVLSFPMLEYPAPADFDFLEEADDSASADDSFNPDTGELMLGDIIISVDHVMAQAEQYGHSIQREYAFLIAHSMLHLMGFDHMTPEEAQVMETEQEKILTPLGYIRE